MQATPFVVAALFVVGTYACSPTLAPAMSGMRQVEHAPLGAAVTNPPEISSWIHSLQNRWGGSCCGEGDKYDVEILEEPVCKRFDGDKRLYDGERGTARVINPAPADVVTQDGLLLKRPKITGNMTFHFDCHNVTPEVLGNPLKHAIAFLGVFSDGNIQSVYCVVPLPPGS